jgi:hypothetical protein
MQWFGEVQEVMKDLEINVLVDVFQQIKERLDILKEFIGILIFSLQ